MGAPPLTIGLPVYNGGEQLSRALDSILNQAFGDFELLIADNASTDNTEEICREYARRDQRVRYERNVENIGAIPNHNLLVHHARSEFFKWAAHDDTCHPDMVSRCMQEIQNAPDDVVLVYPETELRDQDGNHLGYYRDSIANDSDQPSDRLKTLVAKVRLGTPMYGVMRRGALLKTRLLGSFHSSDHVLFAELVLLGKIRQLAAPLFCKQIHSERFVADSSGGQHWASWSGAGRTSSFALRYAADRVVLEYLRGVMRTRLPLKEKSRCFMVALRHSRTEKERLQRWRRRLGFLLPGEEGRTAETPLHEKESSGRQ